jgi:hypothetical protein
MSTKPLSLGSEIVKKAGADGRALGKRRRSKSEIAGLGAGLRSTSYN